MQRQKKEVRHVLEPRKGVKLIKNELSVEWKTNEQVLREIKLKVWKVAEQMSEKPKFIKAGFNKLKEQLKRE